MQQQIPPLTRRAFGLAGGALLVNFTLGASGVYARDLGAAFPAAVEKKLDAWIAIGADGNATLYTGKVELGTGVETALTQIACEELDLRMDQLRVVQGDTKLTPDQGPTWGSITVVVGGPQVRAAAATARARLLALAATALQADAATLTMDGGKVAAPSGKSVGYGQLVGGRQLEGEVDPKAPVKPVSAYRLVGKSVPRVDIPAKVAARFTFVQDVRVPGMLHGRVVMAPRLGASVTRFESLAASKVPGLVRIVRQGDFIGVVAKTEWGAIQAQRALVVEWSGGQAMPSTETVYEQLLDAPVAQAQQLVANGDAEGELKAAAQVFEGRFDMPFQTHGSIGPSCAVADVAAEGVTVWSATQAPHWLRANLAELLGLPEDRVRVIYAEGAGCYGRNGHEDAAGDAVLLSKAVGAPVRVQWMRHQEHGSAPMGPAHVVAVKAAMTGGKVTAWRSEAWLTEQPSTLPPVHMPGFRAAGYQQVDSSFAGLLHANQQPGYLIPHQRVLANRSTKRPVRVSWIRGPGRIHNVFAVESMMDEIALAAGADPVAFRLAHAPDARSRNVIERVARLAKWEPRTGPRAARPATGDLTGRGFAYARYSNGSTYVAMVADVSVDRASGKARLKRMFVSHDCGRMVNPDGVSNQVEGSVIQTASRALLEEMAFDGRQVTGTDWASYPIMRFSDVPEIVVDLVESTDPPMGAGESSTVPVIAAISNAIHDATGVRVRRIPFVAARLKAALDASQPART